MLPPSSVWSSPWWWGQHVPLKLVWVWSSKYTAFGFCIIWKCKFFCAHPVLKFRPVALLPWWGGRACMPHWSWRQCQPKLWLVTGVSLLVKAKGERPDTNSCWHVRILRWQPHHRNRMLRANNPLFLNYSYHRNRCDKKSRSYAWGVKGHINTTTTVLKLVLKKHDARVWIEFIWLWIQSRGGFLWTQ
jgi:hypothetical protein